MAIPLLSVINMSVDIMVELSKVEFEGGGIK
jgi:hypothetical protein